VTVDFDLDAFLGEAQAALEDKLETVTQEDLDKQIPRIKKLLALAERASTPEEAAAFNQRAHKLIARYGVDSMMLNADQPEAARPGVAERWFTVSAPYADYRGMLLGQVTKVLGARSVRVVDGPGWRYHILGTGPDLVRIELLFESLSVQMQRELDWALGRVRAQGAQRKVYSRDFMTAYVVTVRDRLDAAEREASSETPGSAVAIVDRTALVDRRLTELYPNLTTPKRRQSRRGPGVTAGIAAGSRANITGSERVTGAGARRALS
jgi:hypothetical protein